MKDHGIYIYTRLGGKDKFYQTEEQRFLEVDDFFLPYDEFMRIAHKQEICESPLCKKPDYNPLLTPDAKDFPLCVKPGIDLLKLSFEIDKVDWDKINTFYRDKSKQDFYKQKHGYHISIQDTEINEKLLNIEGNSKYQSIIISSDKFKLTMKKTNFKENKRSDSMTIELNVDSYWSGAGNIENRSYTETDFILNTYIQEMSDLFGIYVKYESLIISYIEVNMTLAPMGDTSELIRILTPFQTYLPRSFNKNEDYKYKKDTQSDYVDNSPLKIMKYNGIRAKSTTIEIKLYDKKYEHNHDPHINARKIKTELIRIEFSIWKPKQIKSHFGTYKWSCLTDQDIKDGFFDMFNHYIYRNYEKYIDRGRKELIEYFKTINITKHGWRKELRDYTEKFYRDSAGGFLVFTKSDIKQFVEQINAPSVKSNKSRICKSVEETLIPKTENHPRDRWVYLIQCVLDFSRRLQENEELQYIVEFND